MNTSRHTSRERDAQRKKAKSEEDRNQENMPPTTNFVAARQQSATTHALESHTHLMGLKLILQYGNQAAKQKAVEQLERQVLGALEVDGNSHPPHIPSSGADSWVAPMPPHVPLSDAFRFMQ